MVCDGITLLRSASNLDAWDSWIQTCRTPMPAVNQVQYSTPPPATATFTSPLILSPLDRALARLITSRPRRCAAAVGDSPTSSLRTPLEPRLAPTASFLCPESTPT